MSRFRDREEAGRRLGALLEHLSSREPIVLGLARGGVPVASEVAQHLDCELDVLTVRKIGVPGQPELAMGAVASGGSVIRNHEILQLAGIDASSFDRGLSSALEELEDRERRFRGDRSPSPLAGRWVVLVDDGIATGSTMRAAIEAVHQSTPTGVTVAVPVAAPQTIREMEALVDEVVAVLAPERLIAVGAWYRNFTQTPDSEVKRLLLDHQTDES